MNPPPKTSSQFRELLALPNFRRLWASQLLSQLTINLVNFSILTHIYTSTRSSIAVSFLWISYSLPTLFVAPFSGALVDRMSLKRTMFITNLLQGCTVLIFLLINKHIFALYSLVFIYSLLDQFYVPAQQSSVPWLVPQKLLTAANGIFFLTLQGSFIVGFGLAGILISLIGQSFTIALASSFLFIAAIAVLLLPSDKNRVQKTPASFMQFWQDFKIGYNFLKDHPLVRFPVFLVLASQIFITIVTIILPTYTQEVLGYNLNQASLIMIIPAGLGAFVFTYFLPRYLKIKRKKHAVELGILCAAISLTLLCVLGLISYFKVILAVIIAIGLGVSFAAIITPAQTAIQEHTPADLRGRIYSLLGLLMTVFTLIPLLAAATLSDLIGVAPMMGAFSILLFLSYLIVKYKGDYVLANGLGL